MIEKLLVKGKATVKELQQLCGYLNFLTQAIFPGRMFTCRMYSKYSNIAKLPGLKCHRHVIPIQSKPRLRQHHHICLDKEFRLDCEVWQHFLNINSATVINRPMIDLTEPPQSAAELFFYSDASASEALGFGCVMKNTNWICAQWELGFITQHRPSIEYLKLFAVCAGVLTWERELSNRRMLIHCNNMAVVSMLNNLTSSCEWCMHLLRILVLNGLQFNRRIFAVYVKSSANVLADALSRGQWVCFHWEAPQSMKKMPNEISHKIWLLSKLWIKNPALSTL